MNTNNYLPFDLETALKHPERVVTRDGRKIQDIHYFGKATRNLDRLMVVVDDELIDLREGGNYRKDSESDCDLFLLPEVKECWVNVYDKNFSGLTIGGGTFNTKEEATSYIRDDWHYIKTIRITNEP